MSSYVQVFNLQKSTEVGRIQLDSIFLFCLRGQKWWNISSHHNVILNDKRKYKATPLKYLIVT